MYRIAKAVLALTRLEPTLRLIDHINATLAADDPAITVAVLK